MSELGTDLKSLAFVFASRSAVVLCVYAAGIWGLSPAWLLAPLLLSLVHEKTRRKRLRRRQLTHTVALAGEQSLLTQIQDLPSWVKFPDAERAEWLNKIFAQLWPSVGKYVSDLLRKQSKQQLADLMAQYKLLNFKFDNVDLGSMSPRIGGIKVYGNNLLRSEMIIDMEVFYSGDCVIKCSFNYLSVGIRNISLYGNLRMVCRPLVPTMPLVGAVQVSFLSTPNFDFDMLGVAEVLDIPGVSDLLRNTVTNVLDSIIVTPNKMEFILSEDAMSSLQGTSLPRGYLRVYMIEAKQLMAKDSSLFGKGSSDPYAVISVGSETFQTNHINSTLDPVWNYVCEAGLSIVQKATVNIELWDWERSALDIDDKLGRCSVDLSDIVHNSALDTWVPLEDASSGSVHLRLEWFNLSTNPGDVQKQLALNSKVTNDGPNELSSAVLSVFIDSAEQLPLVKNSSREPSPRVRLIFGRDDKVTPVKKNTRDPVFEENFVFPVVNPLVQILTVQVEDDETDKILGQIELPLQQLTKAVDMKATNTKYNLNAQESPARLTMSLQMAIFTPDRPKSKVKRPSLPEEELTSVRAEIGLKSKPSDDKVSSDNGRSTLPSDSNMNRIPSSKVSERQRSQDGGGDLSVKEDPVVSDSTSLVDNQSAGVETSYSSTDSGAYQLGRVQVSLKFLDPSSLRIGIHQISGLSFNSDSDGSDLYIKSYLLPDRSESKRKTKMEKACVNPVYDEVFTYTLSKDEVVSRTLEIQVVLNKWFATNPVHGMVHLDLSNVDVFDGHRQWLDLRPPATFNTT